MLKCDRPSDAADVPCLRRSPSSFQRDLPVRLRTILLRRARIVRLTAAVLLLAARSLSASTSPRANYGESRSAAVGRDRRPLRRGCGGERDHQRAAGRRPQDAVEAAAGTHRAGGEVRPLAGRGGDAVRNGLAFAARREIAVDIHKNARLTPESRALRGPAVRGSGRRGTEWCSARDPSRRKVERCGIAVARRAADSPATRRPINPLAAERNAGPRLRLRPQ